jgi:drug/metabolite transporter (DMT)-like permease
VTLPPSPRPRRLGRSVAAVFLGLVTGVVLSLGTDAVLHGLRVFPPWGRPMADGLFVLATSYRTIYSVAASYVAARLAPDRPMGHALVLGLLGVVVTIAGAAATWDRGPEFGPKWYPLALVVLALPCAWLGGWLYRRSAHGRESGQR